MYYSLSMEFADKIESKSLITTDRYGFYLEDTDYHQSKKIDDIDLKYNRKLIETRREKKWIAMLSNWEKTIKYNSNKLKKRIRKGVPDVFRGVVWPKLLDISGYKPNDIKYKLKYPDLNAILIDQLDERVKDEIERDIDRTFPNHVLFESSNSKGQSALRRLLQRYAAIDPDVGYCQGMGFIAGLLLTYMTEETSFYCFTVILNHSKGPLRELYLPGMIDARKKLFVFGGLCRQHLRKQWTYMEEQGIDTSMFATEWFMTVFCRVFSFDLVTRVLDIFTYEGFKIVYRVALALIKSVEKLVVGKSFEDIMKVIRLISSYVDADEVIEMAWTIPLKTVHIETLDNQFTLNEKSLQINEIYHKNSD